MTKMTAPKLPATPTAGKPSPHPRKVTVTEVPVTPPSPPAEPAAGSPAVWTRQTVAAALDAPAGPDLPFFEEIRTRYPNLNLTGGDIRA